ncbi:sensor histidine kinase [Nonomuraea sp. NPDC050328]|uniref:sensor histidine kinase n=1 Tax=Nonomuraea sp. NPDC050328 TaxID=3364361 RepID=UPI0037B75295
MRNRLHRTRMRMLYSVRGRATVIAVGVAAVVLSLCGILAVLLIRSFLEADTVDRAARSAREVSYTAVRAGAGNQLLSPPGGTNLVQIVGPRGEVLASSSALHGRPALTTARPVAPDIRIDQRVCPPYVKDCVRVAGFRIPGQESIALAAVIEPRALGGLGLPIVVGWVMVPLLVLIGAGTWWTIGLTFAPVEEIRRELSHITTNQLDLRVPVPETGGEVQRLAETINAGLERLETATARERRFISDASHDLRNPIAGLRTTLEVALDDPEPRPLIDAALRHTDRLNDIVVDLLELARLDARAPAPLSRVELDDLVRAETGLRSYRVPLTLELEPGVEVTANRLRLSRVLNNLLANAERHAAGQVMVTVRRDGSEAVLEVRDDGGGIPEADRERVFERFARLDESRARDPHGTGLGLPIAREIATMYGGTLTAEPSPRGARLVLRLPLAA